MKNETRKRGSPSLPSSAPPLQRSRRTSSSPSRHLVEEVVEDVEESFVLLRFPCFDHFINAHVCEAATTHDDGSTQHSFHPAGLHVVSGTLATDAPIIVLNAEEENEIIFSGKWVNHAAPFTNTAVLHVTDNNTNTATTKNAEGSASSSSLLPSLLTHVEGGVTADEAREQRSKDAAAQEQRWRYDVVAVPTSTLVLTRIK